LIRKIRLALTIGIFYQTTYSQLYVNTLTYLTKIERIYLNMDEYSEQFENKLIGACHSNPIPTKLRKNKKSENIVKKSKLLNACLHSGGGQYYGWCG
jgi:hypothetical protein